MSQPTVLMFGALAVVLTACSTAPIEFSVSEKPHSIYRCDGCEDASDARRLIENELANWPCDPESGSPELWGSEPVPGKTCSAPGERMTLANPENGFFQTFIVHRLDRASAGLAPRVEIAPDSLNSEERRRVHRYLSASSDSEATGNTERETSDDEPLGIFLPRHGMGQSVCPDGTALSILADPEEYERLRQETIERAVRLFQDGLENKPDVLVIGRWHYNTSNDSILLAGVGSDVQQTDSFTIRQYACAEDDFGYWLLEEPDTLVFNAWVRRDPASRELDATASLNLRDSRIQGRTGWFRDGSRIPRARHGRIDRLGTTILLESQTHRHRDGLDWTWHCSQGQCCLEASNICLPEGMHDRIEPVTHHAPNGARLIGDFPGPGIQIEP